MCFYAYKILTINMLNVNKDQLINVNKFNMQEARDNINETIYIMNEHLTALRNKIH